MKTKVRKFTPIIIITSVIVILSIVALWLFTPTPIPTENRKVTMSDNIDTATDVTLAKLRANLGKTAKGYCEDQADAMRGQILNTNNTKENYKITGTTYYISSSLGDNANDGLSPETPFKDIHGMDKIIPHEGDAILFKRGDTFRFGEPIVTYNSYIYGAYGEGNKPKIYGSPENYANSDDWQHHFGNIWKITFDYPEACGLVIDHSARVGIKKTGIFWLMNEGDYYHDTHSGTFYLYSEQGNPSKVHTDIEIMPSFSIFEALYDSSNIVIDNLCLKYASGFAVHAVDANNFSVTNCEIGFIGGKWKNPHEKDLRYGNAIEFWEGAIDITVENNWIYQTFDSALSWQGKIGCDYKNISFSNNLFEYNNADIEFFENGATLENFRIENNVMRFTSMGWGTRKGDGGIRGIEGCIRGVTGSHPTNDPVNIKSVYFTCNTFDCPARQIINWSWEPEQHEVIHTSGSKIYVKQSYRTLDKCLQGLQTYKGQFYGHRSATNLEELKQNLAIFENNAKIYWYE